MKKYRDVPIQYDQRLLWLIAIYLTLILVAFATAAKVISLPLGLSASFAVIPYAMTFLCTDIISELYGYRATRLAVKIAVICALVMLSMFTLAVAAPFVPEWEGQEAYASVLGYTWRFFVAAMAGFVVSQNLDAWLFHKIKHFTDGKHLWLRNNGSTLISQFTDSLIFAGIAFYGLVPLASVIAGDYLIKVCVALLDTVLIYAVVGWLRKRG